ncbi:hypothetical protein DSM104299_05094 [Baekduia alba]|uniref:urea carboxylase-associated family protein n=1 Tax=Baekduia alba TaxID=2997333 RepID=UPI00233FF778|nr:urea carboxylase-associated family protein [Baekduia alba]WCB96337.1 hypothetical protein DSM104299_05094 [Baekduia alba]
MTAQKPSPIYHGSFLPAAYTDTTRYAAIAVAPDQRTLQTEFTIPVRTGHAWHVKAGQVCRVSTPEGPQVGDFNFFNAHNPRERLWAARTRQIQAAHVTTYDRLWSNLPYLRPILTITGDSIDYGVDADGGRCHDLLGSRCDPYMKHLLTGETVNHQCHSNLVRAVAPHGLGEQDVHDVLNIFQVTGLVDDRYFTSTSPAKPGDYFEFMAEIDLLCALSNCPGGDLSAKRWGPEAADTADNCRPLHVEVYDLDAELLDGWESPKVSTYAGGHGLA